MNKKIIIVILVNLYLCTAHFLTVRADSVVDTFKKATGVSLAPAGEQFFVDIIQEKKNQLQKIEEEVAKLQQQSATTAQSTYERLEELTNVIKSLEERLAYNAGNQFDNKKLVLYKEKYQTLRDASRAQEDVRALLENIINLLKQFIEDPEFSAFKKERHLEARSYYSFEDLHTLYDVIVNQERLVAQLAEQEKNLQSEQDSRRRVIKDMEEEHTKRLQDLRLFAERNTPTQASETNIITLLEKQEKELIAIEEELFRYKKELNELRSSEIKYMIEFVQAKLFIERSHLDLLKQHLRIVKSSIRVNEADVSQAKEQLNTQKKSYFARKEELQQARDRLAMEQKEREHQRDQLAKQYAITLGRDLDEWGREPKQTIMSYLTLAQIGALNAQVQWLQKERDLVETLRALEDERFNYIVTLSHAKETYYKVSSRKFTAEDEITQEIKHYETQKAEAQSTLAIYKERRDAVADLLNQQKKILDNLQTRREQAQKQKDFLFRNKTQEYHRLLDYFNSGQEFIKKRIDVLGKLTGVYSGIISEVTANARLLSFIIGELQSITIWYRPEYAITLQGVKNISSDIMTFFSDIRAYFVRFDFTVVLNRVRRLLANPLDLVLLLFKMLLICLLFFVCKRAITFIKRILLQKDIHPQGFFQFFTLAFAALIEFIEAYFVGIALWGILFALLLLTVQDPYIYSIFYLCSIVYLLFLINRFIHSLRSFNIQHDYALLAPDFQERFILVLSTLLYATVTIFFFRQAFMRVTYYRTELPTILLAINFIIFQIALIFLISKEQIISIIPTRNEIWIWIKEHVDHYFYLILLLVITIIVMSNPYVGFGRLVLYLVSSLIYTALLVKGLLWIHNSVKQAASYTFFFTDEEVVRERFAHARTWFGLLIIASFFVITFIGSILTAKIWGWPVTFKDVFALLSRPLLLENTAYPITLVSLLQIIGFVLLGFVAAYALNKFVLDKIFDLLLVDPGVQYTTIRFIQYSVVIIFIFFGFKNVGLGDLIGYILGALAVGIGWYSREPIGDVVAYFIILVQRPLKIGDFVQIDPETIGIVRQITPRAVVIRRKNSTTVVVPNAYIMSKSIVNWNYVRNFIAFNDIVVTVSFKEDAIKVKELLLSAVAAHPNVLRNPKPIVRLEEFGEYGYVFMVRGFISSAYTMEMWEIASDVRLAIVKTLQEHNIQIAELIRIVKDTQNKMARISPQQKEDMGNSKE